VPELIDADVRVHESFLAAMAEFAAEGRGSAHDDTMIGSEMREYASQWHTPAGFAEYAAALLSRCRCLLVAAG
jgi:hypothetical protein